MLIVGGFCLLLLAMATTIHYEVLRGLTATLPQLRIPSRAKLIVAILTLFFAHATEILLYAFVFYAVVHYTHLGTLGDPFRFSPYIALYFSAETYSSLGYGDIIPAGALRLLAGTEVLNGLLLIGWSASYTYVAMERFWHADGTGLGR